MSLRVSGVRADSKYQEKCLISMVFLILGFSTYCDFEDFGLQGGLLVLGEMFGEHVGQLGKALMTLTRGPIDTVDS